MTDVKTNPRPGYNLLSKLNTATEFSFSETLLNWTSMSLDWTTPISSSTTDWGQNNRNLTLGLRSTYRELELKPKPTNRTEKLFKNCWDIIWRDAWIACTIKDKGQHAFFDKPKSLPLEVLTLVNSKNLWWIIVVQQYQTCACYSGT